MLERFDAIAAAELGRPGVTAGQMFGSQGVRVSGRSARCSCGVAWS
jgi:hypothetical protein